MASKANSAAKRREINRDELRRYLAERGKVSHVFDSIEKLEDETLDLEALQVTRIKYAIDTRLALLKKFLPDEKSIEIKNPDGEVFKTDSKWTIEVHSVKED